MKKLISAAAAVLCALTVCLSPVRENYNSAPASLTASAADAVGQLKIKGTEDYASAYKVLELVNSYRKQNGLSELKMDSQLLEAAMQRAAENAVYYSHTRPDNSDFSTAAPRNYNYYAENIAFGYPNASEVMNGWMNSQGHRENILHAEFVSIGIGCHVSSNGVIFWTQLFDNKPSDNVKKSGSTEVVRSIASLGSLMNLSAEIDSSKSTPASKKIVIKHSNQYSYSYADNSSFSFKSLDTDTATVDSSGTVTMKRAGTAVIRATLKSNSNVYCDVKVTAAADTIIEHHDVSVPPYSLGDVDGDGHINASDASAVLSNYAAVSTGNPSLFGSRQKRAADVDSDGTADSSDASSILSYYSYTATGGYLGLTEFLNKV